METPRADDASIAPYTAYATSYREASASTGGGTHVEYTISVFAPGHRFVQLSPSALNVFGAKEKLSEGRTTQDTTSPDDHEIKSLWKTFTSQAKRATGSKLVYSTKIGSARLDERIQLLNATLQVICSSAVLWNHPIVHQFLCLDDASTT
ncbi:hypothetical protein DYB32_003372 [Aphanomyces invadans]|uniref:Uncharacterized protein n=1 Tax=Aphanomyces invadans TaxID=157072 RepID=A0A3R6VP22_9STRA|nr:hypothetical protein DYB32_003372 [Aphanomyces invadans]